ncbi:hypothetical protein OT109_07235 [Phycisphaeraceae bacterium D3-23]
MPTRTCIALTLLTGFTLAGLTGCIGIRAEKIYSNGPTLGQELTDLKAAHEQGVIDDAEYARLRSGLMDERDED